MKKAIYILISLLIMISACTFKAENKVYTQLQEVDSLLRSIPDSAYYLLKHTLADKLQTGEDTAYYRLLLIEAHERNQIELEDTLLMDKVIAYYDVHPNRAMQLRTHRLAAGILLGKKEYKAAMQTFFTALKYAERIDSVRIISNIYHAQDKSFNLQMESLLLKAQQIASSLGNKEEERLILNDLFEFYVIIGEKEKSIAAAKRNIELRKGTDIPEWVNCLFLANCYRQIGETDSANYYNERSKMLHRRTPTKFPKAEEKGTNIPWTVLAIVIALGSAAIYLYHKRLERSKHKINRLQENIEALSADDDLVFEKMNRIIHDFLHQGRSALFMEENDWKKLQRETDKRWNDITKSICQKYSLTETEMRLLCLNLTDIPTKYMSFLFDRGRNTIYVKNRRLFTKLGIERQSENTYKEDLQRFIEEQGFLR